MEKAQGTIEYLVILSVVVVVSLVVVSLMVSQTGSGAGITSATSDIKSKVGSGSISVTDAAASADGEGLIILKNNDAENIKIKKISVDGVDHEYYNTVAPGNEISFKLENIVTCGNTSGSYTVRISYESSTGLEKIANYESVLIDCTESINPIGNFIVENNPPIVSVVEASTPDSLGYTTVTYDVTEGNNPIESCSLFVDGEVVETDSDGIYGTFTHLLPSTGNYSINVICTDRTELEAEGEEVFLENTTGKDYVLISDSSDFDTVRSGLSGDYLLANDIDLENSAFTPIGSSGSPFTGTFIGNGNEVSGAVINLPGTSSVGFFGASTGTIKDLFLTDIEVSGANQVGGFVGNNDRGEIYNSSFTGNVTCTGSNCGGFVGKNNHLISQSSVHGTVEGVNQVGGFVGLLSYYYTPRHNGTIIDSYTTASVTGSKDVGGFVGYSSGFNYGALAIYRCFSSGDVTPTIGAQSVGSFVGAENWSSGNGGGILNSFASGEVTNSDYTIARNYNPGPLTYSTPTTYDFSGSWYGPASTFVNKSYKYYNPIAEGLGDAQAVADEAEFKDPAFALYNIYTESPTWNFESVWAMSPGVNNGFPYLRWENPNVEGITCGSCAADEVCITGTCVDRGPYGNPYYPYQTEVITDCLGLQDISTKLDRPFVLGNDIDCTGVDFIPIGNQSTRFSGSFDGNGFIISNLTINQPGADYIGLFGSTAVDISNLGVENANVTGRTIVGIIAGAVSNATLSNSYSTGTVTAIDQAAGGLIGMIQGGTIMNSYSRANVSGNDYVGGLSGYANGTLENTYSTGSVNSTGSNIGGLVSSSWWSLEYNNFWDTETSGQTTSPIGEGKTTAEMTNITIYDVNNWDISSTSTSRNDGYPFLGWEVDDDSSTWLITE